MCACVWDARVTGALPKVVWISGSACVGGRWQGGEREGWTEEGKEGEGS